MGWLARAMGGDEELWVEVSPEAFVFRTPRATFRLVAEAAPEAAAQVDPSSAPDARPPAPLPLFPTGAAGERAPARYGHLRALLHAAFMRSVDDRVLKLKPRVVMHGAASLDPVLHGYQYELLRRAALEAGARTVRFTEAAPLAPPAGYERAVSPADVHEEGRYRRA